MKEYRFYGRVLPEVRRVTIPTPDELVYQEPAGFSARIRISINDGDIEIWCLAGGPNASVAEVMVRSSETCTAIVDAFAFSRAEALTVIIDEGEWDGVRQPLVLSHKDVEPLCTAFSLEAGFDEICELVLSDVELRLALRDLILSLSTLNYSAIASCRAIEAIRNAIAPNAKGDNAAWEVLRNLLRVDRAYLQVVTDAARNPRHGKRAISTAERSIQHDVTARAWTVMDRYLHFLRAGAQQALPASEFPLLI